MLDFLAAFPFQRGLFRLIESLRALECDDNQRYSQQGGQERYVLLGPARFHLLERSDSFHLFSLLTSCDMA